MNGAISKWKGQTTPEPLIVIRHVFRQSYTPVP